MDVNYISKKYYIGALFLSSYLVKEEAIIVGKSSKYGYYYIRFLRNLREVQKIHTSNLKKGLFRSKLEKEKIEKSENRVHLLGTGKLKSDYKKWDTLKRKYGLEKEWKKYINFQNWTKDKRKKIKAYKVETQKNIFELTQLEDWEQVAAIEDTMKFLNQEWRIHLLDPHDKCGINNVVFIPLVILQGVHHIGKLNMSCKELSLHNTLTRYTKYREKIKVDLSVEYPEAGDRKLKELKTKHLDKWNEDIKDIKVSLKKEVTKCKLIFTTEQEIDALSQIIRKA
jgi:hypothetical protein